MIHLGRFLNYYKIKFMAKKITAKNKAFTQGYVCACAVMIKDHGNYTEVEDALKGIYRSVDDLMRYEIDEYDMEVLMPCFKEIDRKRNINE